MKRAVATVQVCSAKVISNLPSCICGVFKAKTVVTLVKHVAVFTNKQDLEDQARMHSSNVQVRDKKMYTACAAQFWEVHLGVPFVAKLRATSHHIQRPISTRISTSRPEMVLRGLPEWVRAHEIHRTAAVEIARQDARCSPPGRWAS